MGAASFDVSVVCIDGLGTFKVEATNGHTNLGGEHFDNRLVEFCIDDFKKKSGLDIWKNNKSITRLRKECENAKRSLSSSMQA